MRFTTQLPITNPDQRAATKRHLETAIRNGSQKFTVQGFDKFDDVEIGGLFGSKETITFDIQNPNQIVPQTRQEEPDRDETPPPNNDNPPPPPPTVTLDKQFTLQFIQDHGTWTSIQLANPEVLNEANGANYQFVVLSNKTHKDKLKAGNTIRIRGIEVAPDKAWVKSNSFDILDHYQDLELVREREVDDPPPPPPPPTPHEIIFEAIINDPQLKTILTTAKIDGDTFYENYFVGNETSLVNADQTLNYTKIKELLNRTPDSPPNPNGPSSPPPNSPPSDTPTPTQENNQKSEENIKDISQTSSLEEAKQKAKQEINDLFDRYGVKVGEISASLWENEASWETYLTSKCSTVDQVSRLVKKMKMAIIQQSKQNQQANQKLTVPQLRAKIKQEIEKLIKKYPHLKVEQVPALQNWKTDLEKKNSHAELNAFERQLREAIISASRQTTSTSNPKPTWPKKLLIGGGVFFVVAALGCLVVIFRNRRVRQLRQSRKVQQFSKKN